MGDHDLGEPGADGRGRPAGVPRRRRGGVPALGAPLRRRSARSPTPASCVPSTTARRSARSPRASSPTRRRATASRRCRASTRRSRSCRPRPARPRRAARAARLAEHPQPGLDLRALRPPRRLANRPPARARRGRAAAAAVAPRARRLARRARPRRRARRRAPAARWRCSRPRATSPARAASRSGSPTASTSATRRRARSPGSWQRRSRGWRSPPRRCGVPVVSGNVSLYNETDGRAIRPTPVVGCVGLVPDVRAVPGRWREGDVVLLAGSPELSLAGSEHQALYGRRAAPARLDLAAEALLVEFLWRAAPMLSLAHDAAERRPRGRARGGGALERRRRGARPRRTTSSLFGEGGGQAVIACAPEDVSRLGGVPLRGSASSAASAILGVTPRRSREGLRDA